MPWDPMKGERLAPAWTAALKLLADGRWHRWGTVVQTMIDASDLQPRTCHNLLHAGIQNGHLRRIGNYSHVRDTRKIAVGDR